MKGLLPYLQKTLTSLIPSTLSTQKKKTSLLSSNPSLPSLIIQGIEKGMGDLFFLQFAICNLLRHNLFLYPYKNYKFD